MYGLMARAVAMEALGVVAEELRRLRPVLKAVLPAGTPAGTRLDHFFTHDVDAVEDLGTHVYRAVARLLLNLAWLPEAVGDSDKVQDKMGALFRDGKYEVREVGGKHSAWAEQLVGELKAFDAKCACCELTEEARALMWENAALAAADAMVAGFARVRKCTMEGRGLMSLDLQVVLGALKKLAPHAAVPRLEAAMRTVDTYIKAFYVPEGELLHWAQTHPEFTQAQVLALVGQIAFGFKWGRGQLSDMRAKIEGQSGLM